MIHRIFIYFFLFLSAAQAQINIIRPLEGAVYQRNNKNIGWIDFRGTTENVSSLEVKLNPFELGQGIESDWQSVKVENGFFLAKIKGSGGFYILKIKGKKNDGENFEKQIGPVGIGEIFITAGQSNTLMPGPFAESNRVLGVNYALFVPGFPTFIKLTAGNYKWIYPSNESFAFAGKLGDILVSKYNVPVLFMGAGSGGSTVGMWYNSRNNGEKPYQNLKTGIQSFGSEYGLRAVLWHQGETNSLYHKTPSETYQHQLTGVIEQSRKDFNHSSLSWVVARVSWAKPFLTGPSPDDNNKIEFRQETIKGQNAVIDTVPYVFQGPNSDSIEGYVGSELRSDGVHLSIKGQGLLAELWGKHLDSTFFNNSNPYLPFSQSLLSQTISFNTIPDKNVDAASFSLDAKASSNLIVSYKIIEGPATIENNKIKLTGKAGKVTIEASQEGNDSFEAATPIKISFQVLKLKQNISFNTIPDKNVDAASFSLDAKASSNLIVSYKIIEGPATIENNKIKLTGKAGKVTIEASQEGNDSFEAAENIKQSFNVFLLLGAEKFIDIQIFPNPAQNILNIQIEDKIVDCRIINLSGHSAIVFINKLDKNKYQFDISALPNGLHIIEIQTENTVISRKLLINR